MITYVRIIIVTALLGLSQSAICQSNLPPKVQADLLIEKIAEQIKAEEFDAAIVTIGKYSTLAWANRESGFEMPPPLYLTLAKLYFTTGDYAQSQHTLDLYFMIAPQEGEASKEALALNKKIHLKRDPAYQEVVASYNRLLPGWLEIEKMFEDMGIPAEGYLLICDPRTRTTLLFRGPFSMSVSQLVDANIENKELTMSFGVIEPFHLAVLDENQDAIYTSDIKGIESIDRGTWVVTTEYNDLNPDTIDQQVIWKFKTTKRGFSVSTSTDDIVRKYSKDDCPDSLE